MDPRVRALYKIEAQPEGPAQARRIIADELAGRLSAPALDDVKLMVSELVTNGIVHGSSEPDAPVMLDLLVNGHIRCRVLDHTVRVSPPAPGVMRPEAGDFTLSSSYRTGGACSVRHNRPKYGSNGTARDLTSR